MTDNTNNHSQEINKFDKISQEWWNSKGPFQPLHLLNTARINYINSTLTKHFKLTITHDYNKITILDIGCGGGIATESLYKMGFTSISGFDAGINNIAEAQAHALHQGYNINYKVANIANLDTTAVPDKYDVILLLELVEHLQSPQEALQIALSLLKNNGIIFIATINRTIKSLVLAKFAAEYIVRWLPPGTHNWQSFLKPNEIYNFIIQHHELANTVTFNEIKGFKYHPLKRTFSLTHNPDMNYIMSFIKQ